MRCDEFLERHSDYRDGLITASRELRRFARHLAHCMSCRRYDATVRAGVQALHASSSTIALSPDGTRLFVANANINTVAVFHVATPGKSRSLGFIPVGWYPTSVRVSRDGTTLYVVNAKGETSQR